MATNNKADVLQQLRDGITALTDSAAWQRYLDVQRRFHQYSWGNCLLIAIQRPDATRVAGYHAWQKLNRQVNVGEKGIRILAPVTYKKSTTEGPDTNPDDSPEVRVLRSFRSVAVFDISQTSGEPLPEITTRLLGDDSAYAHRRLMTVAGELGYRVEFTELPGERNGECDFRTSTIRVRAGLDAAHVCKTLAHELGHAILHYPSEMPVGGLPQQIVELEAESVAYVVCNELGIDSSQYSLGYIAHWSGDGASAVFGIDTSAARIRKASHVILDALEHGVAEPQRQVSEHRVWVGETLHEEMTGPVAVGNAGAAWPDPLHHVNGRVVPSLLLTVPEACEALRVSRAQLYVMATKQHVIEMVHIGKLCRIPRASVQSYVDNLRIKESLKFAHEDFGLGDGEGA